MVGFLPTLLKDAHQQGLLKTVRDGATSVRGVKQSISDNVQMTSGDPIENLSRSTYRNCITSHAIQYEVQW